jgi:hypothetical protein
MYLMVRMGVAALIIATIAVWSTAQAGDSVVGSWRLVSWVQEDIEGKAVQTVFGDNPRYQLYEFRMRWCDHGSAPPARVAQPRAALAAEKAAIAALFTGFFSR